MHLQASLGLSQIQRLGLPSFLSFIFRAPILMQGTFPQNQTFFKTLGWMVVICVLHRPMILTIELQNLTRTTLT